MTVPKPPPLEPIYVREGDTAYWDQQRKAMMRGIKIEGAQPMGRWLKFTFWWHDHWPEVAMWGVTLCVCVWTVLKLAKAGK